jgi:hypothetical protein
MSSIAIYGAGQLGSRVAAILRERGVHRVSGPFTRDQVADALDSGVDLVIIATTSRLRDVADDVIRAIEAGSNVLVSAEECANPWLVDEARADHIDALARARGITVVGAGLNPGLIFDALVLTLLGATPPGVDIKVTRVVDIGHFGPAVLQRLGMGVDEAAFRAKVASGEILGHAGFPQSMSIVARGLGVHIDEITEEIDPIISDIDVLIPSGHVFPSGTSAGVMQTYTAIAHSRPWFTSVFRGHVRPDLVEWSPQDTIEFWRDGNLERRVAITPGIPAQAGSQSIIANSVDRIIAAMPGWLTVGELPPATGPWN